MPAHEAGNSLCNQAVFIPKDRVEYYRGAETLFGNHSLSVRDAVWPVALNVEQKIKRLLEHGECWMNRRKPVASPREA